MAVVFTAIAFASPAVAQSALLASPPDSAELRELRIAVANGPAQSTLWFGARLEGAADDVYLVVPAAPGARIDLSSDAFFEALADSTHTRVVPPAASPEPSCPAARLPGPKDHDVIGDVGHVETVDPTGPSELMSLSQLVVWTQDQGLSLSFAALSAFADLDLAGYRFLKLHFEVDPGHVTLRTVRVTSPGPTLRVPLLVTGAGAAPADVRVWAFSPGRADPAMGTFATVDSSKVQWSLSGTLPPSNYRDVLGSALDAATWVVDASSHSPIFRSTPMFGGAVSVPALVDSYFERAAGYGDAQADPTPCTTRAASLESSLSEVSTACAAGLLASLAGPSCEEASQPGQIAPDDLRCGGIADDLALAMTGTVPGRLWLTRWAGRFNPWTERSEDALAVDAGAERSVVLMSGGWDTTVCESDAGTGGGSGTGGAGGSGGGVPGTGGSGVAGGTGTYYPPEDPYYDDDYDDYGGGTQVYVEGSCWGDTSSTRSSSDDDDSCSGDSSSSGEDSTCSGDSSSSSSDSDSCSGDSSDSGDETCSGDSSDSGGETCSGDSSDSGSEACSGDSGGSAAGESCGGDSSDCTVAHRRESRGGRLPISAMTLLLVASALAARRFRRDEERKHPFR